MIGGWRRVNYNLALSRSLADFVTALLLLLFICCSLCRFTHRENSRVCMLSGPDVSAHVVMCLNLVVARRHDHEDEDREVADSNVHYPLPRKCGRGAEGRK